MFHSQGFWFCTLRVNPLKPGTTAGTLQAEKHCSRLPKIQEAEESQLRGACIDVDLQLYHAVRSLNPGDT